MSKQIKAIVVLCGFLLFFLGVACEKKETQLSPIHTIYAHGDQEFGYVIGEKNGREWEASSYWVHNIRDSSRVNLFLTTYDDEEIFEMEAIEVFNIPYETGNYRIEPNLGLVTPLGTRSSSYYLLDGDAVFGSLIIDSTRQNFVIIEAVDSTTGNISGTFQLYYELDGIPRLSFENCRFEARQLE